ncbi:hypothetical protein K435DRAFT_906995 [Dendrothele bispora CBS 962.96]|uniref:Uncharacterized protein n=1 Tax=Dendrothele bispora (strain CBS 962.96) TaxID=1314807 RepID=A0A4S8KK00_DENBC|nr:hypothetical protein K435DRAFT_906995 [Dendrothele bispora CBS 962.96]
MVLLSTLVFHDRMLPITEILVLPTGSFSRASKFFPLPLHDIRKPTMVDELDSSSVTW